MVTPESRLKYLFGGKGLVIGLFVLIQAALLLHIDDLCRRLGLPSNYSGFLMSLVQSLNSALACFWTFSILSKNRQSSEEHSWQRALSLGFLSLAIADFTYGAHYYLLKHAYRNTPWFLVHQIPYILAMYFVSEATIRRALQRTSKSEKTLIVVLLAILSSIYLLCSYQMVLSYSFPTGYNRPWLNLMSSYIYAVFQSVAVGGLLVASLRTPTVLEFFLWFLFITMNGSDFALRYQDVGVHNLVPSLFEYGWNVAVLGFSAVALFRWVSFEDEHEPFFLPPTPANSIRVLVPFSTLTVLGLFIVLNLTIFPYFRMANVNTISGHALSFAFVWFAANGMGLYLSRVIQRRIQALNRQIEVSQALDDLENIKGDLVELNPIVDSLKGMKAQLSKTLEENLKARSLAAVADAASKLVHRIKSPLIALEEAHRKLPPDDRGAEIIIRKSLSDLKAIVEELKAHADRTKPDMIQGVQSKTDREFLSTSVKPVNLGNVIQRCIVQKRVELGHTRIEIVPQLWGDSLNLYSNIDPAEFSGILSDLINNAVEATLDTSISSIVAVRLHSEAGQHVIQIIDRGRGVQPEDLSKVGTLGYTAGKPGGSGRGVYDAISSIRKWGGEFSMSSEPLAGSIATIRLKPSTPPNGSVTELFIPRRGIVCVVDDSPAVLEMWKQRLAPHACNGEVSAIFHSNPDEFESWFQNDCGSAKSERPTVFFVDYEFPDHEKTGLDLIQACHIAEASTLVSDTAKPWLFSTQCFHLQIPFMPKDLAKDAEFIFWE